MPDDLDELVEKLKREPCAWCSCRHTPGPEHCLRVRPGPQVYKVCFRG